MLSWGRVCFWVVGAALAASISCSATSGPNKAHPGAGASANAGGTAGGSAAAGNGSGGIVIITDGGPNGGAQTCTVDTGPYCGDGLVNQASEQCDDGNALPGDGCNGVCVTEPNSACPPAGGPCMSTVHCGDGVRSPGEGCDDGNMADGDGCAGDCSSVDPGYYCPTPGQPCLPASGKCNDGKVQAGETCDDGNTVNNDGCSSVCRVETGWRCTVPGQPCVLVPVCGNGKIEASEQCDDNNTNSADGCSSTCKLEPGFMCATAGQACRRTVCGDGKREGSECCDDGNQLSFDGCTPDCRCEPACPTTGACTSKCGNGIIETGEQCDDGNTAGTDGCSATCQVESGFKCESPKCMLVDGKCALDVPVVYRDFNFFDSPGGHPDFQPNYNSAGVATGLVQPTWDANRKPVQSAAASTANGFMHGQSNFAMWYRSPGEPGATGSLASAPIAGNIRLWDNGAGGYVNRWGVNGEQWAGPTQYTNVSWCSNTADPTCTHCGGNGDQVAPAGVTCFSPCTPYGANSTQTCYGNFTATYYDGNPLFFPIDPPTAKILNDTRVAAAVPAEYGWSWQAEADVAKALGITTPILTAAAPFPSATHNFSFTTEVKWWFRYTAALSMQLDFTGDDDLWVFVNGKLAVDLGGWHVPTNGSVTINAANAATYGLVDGSVYTIGIFQAERETTGSSFKLTLSGFTLAPSQCSETCGDGIVTISEECDNGVANSDDACAGCRTDCKFGPHCGDSVVQASCGEACDDGVNVGGYNQCGTGCMLAERCGDGVVQMAYGEQCDEGALNGTAGHCTTDCGVPAFCGDGVVQTGETCDNGINDNSYGGCSNDCQFGPRCGDGVVQTDFGEDCDQGSTNADDVYGGCTTRCQAGPHCGDGVVQGTEECDPGTDPGATASSTTNSSGCDASNSRCDAACQIVPIK